MKKYILFLLPLLLVSCNQDNDVLKSSPIDSNIKIRVIEKLESNEILLDCKTEKAYPCYNNRIQVKTTINKQKQINVNFLKVIEEPICATAFGPATVSINLGKLSERNYEIQLNNGGESNKGILKVLENEIVLEIKEPKEIEIVTTNTKKVPKNTYWGIIGYARETSESTVNSFINKLTEIGVVFSKQVPGDYYYYQINDKGEYDLSGLLHGYYFAKAIIFQYFGDETILRDLIQVDAKMYHAENISIRVTTYKNEVFFNWANLK